MISLEGPKGHPVLLLPQGGTTSHAADQFQLVAGKKRRSKKRRVDDAAARGAVEISGVPVATAGGRKS